MNIAEQIAKYGMAKRYMDISRLDRQNAMNRRLVRKTIDGSLGKPDEPGESMDDEDGTNINIGDQTYHIQQPEQPEQPEQPVSRSGTPSWLFPVASAVLGPLGGVGAVLGYQLLFSQPQPAPSSQPPATAGSTIDTDSQYDIGTFDYEIE